MPSTLELYQANINNQNKKEFNNMENKYENCHICRRKCENDGYNDGYNQALEDIAQLVQIERGKLGSHLRNAEFMYGWDSLEDVIKKVKLNIATNKKSSI